MQVSNQTSKAYFTSLGIIHGALLFGQVSFAFVAFFINASGQGITGTEELNEIFQVMAPAVVIGGLIGSTFLTRGRLRRIKEKTELKDKLGDYFSALILKLAILEGPALFYYRVLFFDRKLPLSCTCRVNNGSFYN